MEIRNWSWWNTQGYGRPVSHVWSCTRLFEHSSSKCNPFALRFRGMWIYITQLWFYWLYAKRGGDVVSEYRSRVKSLSEISHFRLKHPIIGDKLPVFSRYMLARLIYIFKKFSCAQIGAMPCYVQFKVNWKIFVSAGWQGSTPTPHHFPFCVRAAKQRDSLTGVTGCGFWPVK